MVLVFGHDGGFPLGQIADQFIIGQGFFFVKDDFVGFQAFGSRIGFMSAVAEAEGTIVPAGHLIGHGNGIAFRGEDHAHIIFPGEAFMLFLHQEGSLIFFHIFNLPLKQTHMAMLGHGIALAFPFIAVFPEAAGHGEKDGGAHGPESGIPLPDIFLTVLIHHGLQFSALGGDHGGDFIALNGNQAHSSTPLSLRKARHS